MRPRGSPSAVLLDVRAQGREVERLQCSRGVHTVPMVRYQKHSVNEVHIRFDTGEAPLQRVEQWARMSVVIMRMGMLEWRGLREGATRARERGREENDNDNQFDRRPETMHERRWVSGLGQVSPGA